MQEADRVAVGLWRQLASSWFFVVIAAPKQMADPVDPRSRVDASASPSADQNLFGRNGPLPTYAGSGEMTGSSRGMASDVRQFHCWTPYSDRIARIHPARVLLGCNETRRARCADIQPPRALPLPRSAADDAAAR